MKYAMTIFVLFHLIGCSESDIEEFTFRETLKYTLSNLCVKDDKGCQNAVDTQTKMCMDKSNWREFLKNKDDKKEANRFKKEFYSCIVDPEGRPYFVLKG